MNFFFIAIAPGIKAAYKVRNGKATKESVDLEDLQIRKCAELLNGQKFPQHIIFGLRKVKQL